MHINDDKLYHRNGKFLGLIELDEDGFYKFWPDLNLCGYWDGNSLKEIADILHEKNKDWAETIERELSK